MPNVTVYNGKMTANFCFHPLKKEDYEAQTKALT